MKHKGMKYGRLHFTRVATTLFHIPILFLLFSCHLASNTEDTSLLIINGVAANPVLQRSTPAIFDSDNEFQCGGILLCLEEDPKALAINEHWMITAAHCPLPTRITFGPNIVDTSLECSSSSSFSGGKHGLWNNYYKLHANDLALYKISCKDKNGHGVDMSEKTTCLMWNKDKNFLKANTEIIAAGFGKQNSSRTTQNPKFGELLEIPLKIERLSTLNGGKIDADPLRFTSTLSATWDRDKKGIANNCHGDSGGPALVKKPEGTYLLVGVLSTSTCERSSYPTSGWSNIAYYESWIQSMKNGNESFSPKMMEVNNNLESLKK